MKNKKIKVIVIVLVVILLLVGIVEIVLFSRKKEPSKVPSRSNEYNISSQVEEAPGTVVFNSPTLAAEHCLDSICVQDVTFYYTDEGGRIEYTVVNKTQEVASGFLKLVFGNQSLRIVYQDVPVGGKIKSGTFYSGKKIESMDDYHLEHLSKEDNKKIIYSK